MSTGRSAYQPFFAYLQSLNFHFLDAWVIECVDYYKSNSPNASLEVIKNGVKQQWLLVNLRELKVPSLPPNLKSKDSIVLNGKYAVQVESMIDSSESCYSQFQKLQKINTENIEATNEFTEWNIKSSRCLTFVMCDGVQEIQAMEYQPIKKIRTNDPELLPGFKMIIIGPVECRKGMILLKDENVRVCGGEVDTLTVSNNLKSILIERLQLDETDYLDNDHSNSAGDNNIPQPSHNMEVTQANLDEECVESLLSQNDDLFLSLPLETEMLAQEIRPTDPVDTNDLNKTDLFSEHSNYWSEDGVNQCNETSKPKKHNLSEEDLLTSTQKRLSLDPDLENSETEPSKWNVTTKTTTDCDDVIELLQKPPGSALKIKKPVQTKLSSFFKNNESSSNSVCRTSTDPQPPLFTSDKPFVYLKQVMSTVLNKADVFLIKGIILTLRKKITIENDNFNLKANVTDGSACVDVDFSSGILEELLGFSPCEMTAMMKARPGNTAIAQRIKETFSKTQEKLISLNCLMKIKFFEDGRSPLVLVLEEVTLQHLRALKERRLKEINFIL